MIQLPEFPKTTRKFGILEGTKYERPGGALTPRTVAREVVAPMQDHHTPISSVESILYPSAPWTLVNRVKHDPPDTFDLLPIVELSDGFMYTPIDKMSPLAPAVPFVEKLKSGYIVAWKVVRCPYCGGEHQHSGTDGYHRTKEEGIPEATTNLGGRLSHCDTGLSGSWRGDEYRLIGITRKPRLRELDKYFPLHPDAARKHRDHGNWSPGGCYLVKAGPHYKIGISTNPEKRIQSLQTGSPYPVETIHIEYIINYRQLETEMHQQFSEYRAHGEWFAFPDHLIPDVIATMKSGAA